MNFTVLVTDNREKKIKNTYYSLWATNNNILSVYIISTKLINAVVAHLVKC